MKPQLLRDTDPDKVRYKNLVDSIGKSNLHALFPNDFEDYFIALELVDSKKVTEAFVTFPVNPNSISESQPVLTNIKKTAGGIVSVGVETFVPRDIEIKGNFGRNLKIQIGNNFFIGGLISFVRNNDTTEFGRPSFSTESKTGYGVLKSLERILDDSEKLDSFGKPKNLQFDLYSLQFRLPFFVRNGSFLDLNVLGFDGQLFYGKDDKLADITIPNAFELKGGETATGEILISIDYGELLSELTEILRDGNILQSAYIKGRFKTSFISLPVRQKLLEAA